MLRLVNHEKHKDVSIYKISQKNNNKSVSVCYLIIFILSISLYAFQSLYASTGFAQVSSVV